MAGTVTLAIIKPDAVGDNLTGPILEKINNAGFHISAIKKVKLNEISAEQFYVVHKGEPFYDRLIEFMITGPIIVAILEKENAVEDFRRLIGATDPEKAEKGTIRQLYAKSVRRNAVHGSDSDENAKIECDFFFSRFERFSKFD
jgi:nucleoside-diphosphate kinase